MGDRRIRQTRDLFFHDLAPSGQERIKEDDARQFYARLLQKAHDDLRLKPVEVAPDSECHAPFCEGRPHLVHGALKRRFFRANRFFRFPFPAAKPADRTQPLLRFLRADRIDIGKVRRAETLMNVPRQVDEKRLLLVAAPSEHDEKLRRRHDIHLRQCEIRRKLPLDAQGKKPEQAAQFLHVLAVDAAAVAEQHDASRTALCRFHEAIDEHACSVKVACIILAVKKAVRRDGADGQAKLLLHLLSHGARIVADDAAHTGIGADYRLRLIFFCGEAYALAQTILAAKNRLCVRQRTCQKRHRREAHLRSRRTKAMETSHIHAVGDVSARTRAVEDDESAAHEGERTPDARHAAAAIRAAHHHTFRFSSHSFPPDLPTLQTPSAWG